MIDKSILINKITGSKEAKDYTYAILFLLVSSFLAFSVIKPVLSIAVSLNKEAKELKQVNAVFEKNINNMVALQNEMQEIRSQTYLVDLAVPKQPSIQQLMQDIRASALDEGMELKTIEVTQSEEIKNVQLSRKLNTSEDVKSKITAKPITIQLIVKSDFDQAVRFIKRVMNQKRLKTVSKIALSKEQDKKGSNFLTINMEIKGYHL